jgi:hypothetical protein
MSPINYNEAVKLEHFCPRKGESTVIHIRSCERVVDPDNSKEKNYFESKTQHAGYRDEFTLTSGRIFYLNNWSLSKVFAANEVTDGDKIRITHVDTRQYTVEVLERGTGIGVEVPDLEKDLYNQLKKSGGLDAKGKIPEDQLIAVRAQQDALSGQPVAAAPVVTPPVTPPVTPEPVATPAPVATPPVAPAPAPEPVAEEDGDLDLPF